MVRTRLDLIARDLAERIASASPAQQRLVSIAVCKLAVERSGIGDVQTAVSKVLKRQS
jgi:hypothetical protein